MELAAELAALLGLGERVGGGGLSGGVAVDPVAERSGGDAEVTGDPLAGVAELGDEADGPRA